MLVAGIEMDFRHPGTIILVYNPVIFLVYTRVYEVQPGSYIPARDLLAYIILIPSFTGRYPTPVRAVHWHQPPQIF